MKIELNTVYNYEVKDFSFDILNDSDVIDCFLDGRVFSHFSERLLEKLFPELTRVDEKNYDFIREGYPNLDAKTYTRRALEICPSNMLGQGRVFKKKEFEEIVLSQDYIIVDNTAFPQIKIVFVHGKDIIKDYPNGKVTPTKRKQFWERYEHEQKVAA